MATRGGIDRVRMRGGGVGGGFAANVNSGFPDDNNRVVAKGGQMPNNTYTVNDASANPYQRYETRYSVVTGGQAIKQIQLVYYNGYVFAGEQANNNAVTVEAALEKVTGGAQTVMATWGGNPNVTIPAGGYAISDPILPSAFSLASFPANTTYYSRSGWIVSGNQTVPQNTDTAYPHAAGQYAVASNSTTNPSSSQIANTGALVVPTGGAGFLPILSGPVAVIGQWSSTADISVYLDGDSIIARLNDAQDNGTAGGGFATNGLRSVNGRCIPVTKVARGGEQANHWLTGTNAFRKRVMSWCTHYFGDFGTNDLYTTQAGYNTYTAAQTITAIDQIAKDFKTYARGPKYYTQSAITIRCTSASGNYTSDADQTPIAAFNTGGARFTVNNTMQNQIGANIDATFDPTPYWNSSTKPTVWYSDGAVRTGTADGTHPSPLLQGNSSLNTAFVNMASTWTLTPTTPTNTTWADTSQMTWSDGTLTTWSA